MRKRTSKVLTSPSKTVIATAVQLLGRDALGPVDIAERGIQRGLLRVPKGRSKAYLIQIIQSTLYTAAHYASNCVVTRTSRGLYRARRRS